VTPPGVPADRVTALRDAFMSTMQDQTFRAEAEKAKLEILPVSGSEVETLIHEVYGGRSELVKKAAELLK
jgi:tripartite-type tricarboxylate transporter receptor subunit TctC